MKLQFYPYDFEYHVEKGKVNVYLYSRLENGEKICVICEHQPYFYIDTAGINISELEKHLSGLSIENKPYPAKVLSWEKAEKEFSGKKKVFWKIYVNYPKAVPLIAKKLQTWGIESYEKDILFIHRFLRDKSIMPMTLLEADVEEITSSLNIPAYHATELRNKSPETLKNWKILAFDIETYAERKEIDPEKNPILMAAFYGVDNQGKIFEKVITWKEFPTEKQYIEFVDDERSMIEKIKNVFKTYQPDIVTGYFSDGFDFPYLKKRADIHNVVLDIGVGNTVLQTRNKASFRDGETKITGMLHLDILKFIKNIFGKNLKTDSLSLNAVSSELLGHKKHDVNLDELADVWDSHSDKLEVFCEYNLHDARLTYTLCSSLLFDMIEFSKIVGLPCHDVIRMGFSRLVESYIMKRSMGYGVIAPNRPGNHEVDQRMAESIKGAFVYEPTPGLYSDILVFDFRSLYPTVITAHNIGPEALQCSCCKDDKHVPGLEQYWFCRNERKFLPTVLEDLITRRMELKKEIKKASENEKKILEARSYALKTLANSFYGYLGFFGARWYCLPCAASTTAYARDYIQRTIKKAEEQGFEIIYGDSLTYGRMIFVMDRQGNIQLVKIGEFVDQHIENKNISHYQTLAYDGNKLVFTPIKRVIRHYYNSKEKGEILTFITVHGKTKVTPQHSVYTYKEEKISVVDAKSLKIGDSLVSLTNVPKHESYFDEHVFDMADLHLGTMDKEIYFYPDNIKFPPMKGICPYCQKNVHLSSHVFYTHKNRKIPKNADIPPGYGWVGVNASSGGRIPRYWRLNSELAWILGYYCADGSLSDIQTKTGRKCMVSFGSQDKLKIERVKKYFDGVLKDNLKIIVDYDKRINKKMYYFRIQRIPLIGLFEHGFGCGKGSRGKKVPDFILSSEEKIRRAFLKGYLDGDGNQNKDKKYKTYFPRFSTNSMFLACGLQYLFKSLDNGKNHYGKKIKHIGWSYRNDKPDISSLRIQSVRKNDGGKNFCATKIKEIKKDNYEGYVYDLEVSDQHNFVDAEGLILVHNTDSLFTLLGDKKIDEAMAFMDDVNAALPGQMELEFEGFFPKGIFVAVKGTDKGAKKKYALLRDNGSLKITGFETVRRNWSILAKELQKDVLRLVLEDKQEEAFEHVREIVEKLKQGKIPLDKLILKSQITKELSSYTSIGPHVYVAKRLADKGERIVPGTVVEYVITSGSGLIRDKAKHPSEIQEGQYDAAYYLNHQLIPAVSSIFLVLGYSEEDIFKASSQKGLGSFF